MCTALTLTTRDHYFGRNLDLDRSFGEEVCVLPRRCPYPIRGMGDLVDHYAMLGMATVVEDVPLFYDAVNEHGLAMAGLNFPGNAYYPPAVEGCDNVPPYALIPWVLGQCRTADEAVELLERSCLADISFNEQIPPAPLHWIITDRDRTLVIESMRKGLRIHNNTVGVLTNNPPFSFHLSNNADYSHLRPDNTSVPFADEDLPYSLFCQGMGAVGLPGDLSSMSRFVRAAFGRTHSICPPDEASSVAQLFHLLASVAMVRGSCLTDDGRPDITVYAACLNLDRGLYYYTTYQNPRPTCIDLHRTDLDAATTTRYPLRTAFDVYEGN